MFPWLWNRSTVTPYCASIMTFVCSCIFKDQRIKNVLAEDQSVLTHFVSFWSEINIIIFVTFFCEFWTWVRMLCIGTPLTVIVNSGSLLLRHRHMFSLEMSNSLYGNQCSPWTDCSSRSSLFKDALFASDLALILSFFMVQVVPVSISSVFFWSL